MAIGKDDYYFPHFAGARNDRKIKRLRKEMHAEGYGIYFMILEVLRYQADFTYPMKDIDLLADDLGTSEAKVKAVIVGYDLFILDEKECFFSPKLIEYLQPYLEKSQRAKDAANKRWSDYQQSRNANAYANALPEQSKSNADQNAIRLDNKRLEENKEKKKKKTATPFVPPSLEDVKEYFKLNGYREDVAERAWKGYDTANWIDSRGNPVKNWKQKMVNVWFVENNRVQGAVPIQVARTASSRNGKDLLSEYQ